MKHRIERHRESEKKYKCNAHLTIYFLAIQLLESNGNSEIEKNPIYAYLLRAHVGRHITHTACTVVREESIGRTGT